MPAFKNELQPITAADHPLYRSFFPKSPATAIYGDSWAYITQACRGIGEGLGLRYLQDDALFSIGFHRGHYVVVNPLGSLDALPALMHHLQQQSGKAVFVKKLRCPPSGLPTSWPHPSISPCGPSSLHAWDADAFADDDTFPEQVLDLDLTLRHAGTMADWFAQYRLAKPGATQSNLDSTWRAYRQFRRAVRHFQSGEHRCSVVPFAPAMLPELEAFILRYFHSWQTDAAAAYANLLNTLRSRAHPHDEFCSIIRVGSQQDIAGFVFAERVDACSAGLYARLIPRSVPFLPEYAMSQVLCWLREAGIRYLNLGGSETLGLYQFKQKLAPVEERPVPLWAYSEASDHCE